MQKHFKQKENLLSKNHSFAENDSCTFLESQIKFVANDLKSVFGVEWNTQNDEFLFHFSSWIDLARSLETTKRNVLKISASFYDPLGLISLVTAQKDTQKKKYICNGTPFGKRNILFLKPWQIKVTYTKQFKCTGYFKIVNIYLKFLNIYL